MKSRYFEGGMVFDTDKGIFEKKNIGVSDKKIAVIEDGAISKADFDEVLDVSGKYVIPSYVDCHTHGALLERFSRSDKEGICRLIPHYCRTGTSTVIATTTTDTFEDILRGVENIVSVSKSQDDLNIDGIHIEGPFLSYEKRGAHNAELLTPPDAELMRKIVALAGNLAVRVTLAPELPGSIEFIAECRRLGVQVSIGHTAAACETCLEAVKAGASSFTHTYNAMSSLLHRAPGAVGAAFLSDAYAEVISDGVHVDKNAVAVLYKTKKDKTVLITDSVQAAGVELPDGTSFMSAGLEVFLKDGQARLADGTLAGSRLDMHSAVCNFSRFCGIPFGEALLCATRSPALLCGIYDKTGSLEVGKRADMNILSDSFELLSVYTAGKCVKA